jgi:hypothetical protein
MMAEGAAGCPGCYTDGGAGPWCDRACEHPACAPCAHDRWAAAHPLEAAREAAEDAEERAQDAFEYGWEDWREHEAAARAAWRRVDELEALA